MPGKKPIRKNIMKCCNFQNVDGRKRSRNAEKKPHNPLLRISKARRR